MEKREGPSSAQWLSAAAAVLLVVGVVSAGVVGPGGRGSDPGVVSAAGRTGATVDTATSSTTPVTLSYPAVPPPTSAPPSTVGRSTTVPKAAAAVLAAIGSTAPTTRPAASTSSTRGPVTSTTAPAATTTTVAVTTTVITTSTTLPAVATLTLANEHPNAFVVTVNRQELGTVLAHKQSGPFEVSLPAVTDTVDLGAVSDPGCVAHESGDLLQPGGRYLLTIVAGAGACADFAAPELRVTPA